MRNSYHYGHTVGAKVTELRRGSVNSVSIGRVERKELGDFASITFQQDCQLTGKAAKALAATLSEIKFACARGGVAPAEQAAQFDAAIINCAPRRLS
jgi:hypothetical protein